MARKNMLQDCFSTHSLLHSLTGLGVGVLLVALFPGLAIWWLGVVIIVVGGVLDYMQK